MSIMMIQTRKKKAEDAELPKPLCLSEIARFSGVTENTLELHSVIDSTNTRALMLAASGSGVLCVLAEAQTAGRGKQGRSFFSPPGFGLYMSVLIRASLSPEACMLLTPYAAVAVADSLRAVSSAEPKIKWVNDIYLHQKKVCGILTEPVFSSETGLLSHAVVGIGINVAKQRFPDDLCAIASSVENEYDCHVDRSQLAGEILKRLLRIDSEEQLRSCLPAYRKDQLLLGKEITVYRGNETFRAKALAITEEGALLVRDRDGRTFPVFCGEVSVRQS